MDKEAALASAIVRMKQAKQANEKLLSKARGAVERSEALLMVSM